MTHRSAPLSRARRRAFTLINMLVMITLVAAAVAVAGKLFTASAIATRQSHAAQISVRQWRQITTQLRADVWRSERIETPDDLTVDITMPGGRVVRWQRLENSGDSGQDNVLLRMDDAARADAPRKRWIDHGWRGTFMVVGGADGAVLIVDLPAVAYVPRSSLCMIAQRQVVAAAGRGDTEVSP